MTRIETDIQHIKRLVAEGEHCQQDFKFEISDAKKIARSISAFSNTIGGRLLIGVKDNGKIAGIRSEEEIYMIEAAANMYCQPAIGIQTRSYHIEGKTVLEICIEEASDKPIYALDESNAPKAYIRIKDENILTSPVHLRIWQQSKKESGTFVRFTEKEQKLLDILKAEKQLTLNQCCKLSRINRATLCKLLADFIRFGLVTQTFEGHKFYFSLKEE